MSNRPDISRRALLRHAGIGSLALQTMLAAPNKRGPHGSGLLPTASDFAPRAKAIIQLVQNGGPSQMDLFDPKPELQRLNGKHHTFKVDTFQPGSESNELLGSPFEFRKAGRAGMDFSELLTHTPNIADEICLIRSMYSEHNNHTEALIMYGTGKIFRGRPTLGAWVTYALGTENSNLPAYIVLRDPEGYSTNGTLNWDNGWLSALYSGTEFNTSGSPVLNLTPSQPTPRGVQAEKLSLLAKLNEEHKAKYPLDTDLEARIRNYELAAKMQLSAGPVERIRLNKEALRPGQRIHKRLRRALPNGPPRGRSRSPVRASLPPAGPQLPTLGLPHERQDGEPNHRQSHGARLRRPGPRPEESRPPRRDGRNVGRRIRPPAGLAKRKRP